MKIFVFIFLMLLNPNGPRRQEQDPGQPWGVGQGDKVECSAGELHRWKWNSQKSRGKNQGGQILNDHIKG